MNEISIVWFRKDLRLDDNPAFINASKVGSIIPIFIFDQDLEEYSNIGGASLWWLEKSLTELNKKLLENLTIFLEKVLIF